MLAEELAAWYDERISIGSSNGNTWLPRLRRLVSSRSLSTVTSFVHTTRTRRMYSTIPLHDCTLLRLTSEHARNSHESGVWSQSANVSSMITHSTTLVRAQLFFPPKRFSRVNGVSFRTWASNSVHVSSKWDSPRLFWLVTSDVSDSQS